MKKYLIGFAWIAVVIFIGEMAAKLFNYDTEFLQGMFSGMIWYRVVIAENKVSYMEDSKKKGN